MTNEKGTFGEVIRRRRRLRNLTQGEIAKQIKTSTPYVGHLESGKRHPSNEILTRLADVLGFDRRELFFLANPAAKALLHPPESDKHSSAWDQFRHDRHLHRAYNINRKEMSMLSQVALLGQVRSPRDFVYILTTIRHAMLS